MAHQVDTAACASEGSDSLRQLFEQYNQLKIEWYHHLQRASVDYDLLIMTQKDDLKNILKDECKLSGVAAQTIINILRKNVPDSAVYQDANRVRVSVVSTEEMNAISAAKKASARIAAAVTRVQKIRDSLQTNVENSTNEINGAFNGMTALIDERRATVLAQLHGIADAKNRILAAQQKLLGERMAAVNDFCDRAQALVKNIDIDGAQRKKQILTESQALVTDAKLPLAISNDKVGLKIDTSDMKDILGRLATVYDPAVSGANDQNGNAIEHNDGCGKNGRNGKNEQGSQHNLQPLSEARNQIAALEIKLRDLRNQNEALKNQMAASKIEHAQKHGQLNESHVDEKQSGYDYSIGNMYGANGNNSSSPAVLNGSRSIGKDVKTFRCILCEKENNVGDVFVFQTCGCSKSCRKCSLQYISGELKGGKWPIKCPTCFQRMQDDRDILMCNGYIQAHYQTLMMSRNDMTCPQCSTTSKFSNWRTIGPTIVCPSSKCGHPRFSACKECFVDWKIHKGFDCDAAKLLMNDPKHYATCCGKLLVNRSEATYPYQYKKWHAQRCPRCSIGICFGCGTRFNGGLHKCPPK